MHLSIASPGVPPPPPPPRRPWGIWPLRFTRGWRIWPWGGLWGWGALTNVNLHRDLRVYPWPIQWTNGPSCANIPDVPWRGGAVWPFPLSPGGVLGNIRPHPGQNSHHLPGGGGGGGEEEGPLGQFDRCITDFQLQVKVSKLLIDASTR